MEEQKATDWNVLRLACKRDSRFSETNIREEQGTCTVLYVSIYIQYLFRQIRTSLNWTISFKLIYASAVLIDIALANVQESFGWESCLYTGVRLYSLFIGHPLNAGVFLTPITVNSTNSFVKFNTDFLVTLTDESCLSVYCHLYNFKTPQKGETHFDKYFSVTDEMDSLN